MPTLSFVLPVHGEQAYVAQCAASLLGQSLSDVELIAVDDASPDHAPEVLDELAARDPRVRLQHLESRVGRGPARDLGLELAEGEYVWFVETTDTIPAGSLALVAERLAAERPEVLLVHHSRADLLGKVTPGPHRRLLAGVEGTTTLERDPTLAAAAPRAWDKVLRRELLDGLRFGPGAHDELTVTWPALLAARSIATLPEAVYVRHEPPNRERWGSPLDVFAQYEAVLAAAGERRALVEPAMRRHELALLSE